MSNLERVENLMSENNLFGEVWSEIGDVVIAVEILWGDWKYSHLRLKWLIENNMDNFVAHTEETTEEDGSDCYSAIHRFVFQ